MICSVLILMSFWGLLKGNSSFESMNDYLVNLFVGHPVNDIRIIEFLEMLVLNTTPIYITAIFLEQESSERSLFVNIRFGKGIKWMNSILKTSMLFVVSYVLLNIAIPFESVFCVILRILLFVYPYLVHLVHLVTIFKLSSCSSCSPLAPPHHVRCFTHPFCTFIGGKFDVLDWIAES